MQLKTILNRVQRHRSFVYTRVRSRAIRRRSGSMSGRGPPAGRAARAVGKPGSGHDTLEVRRFWARRLSWKEVAEVFRTIWDKVFAAMEMAVEWGRAHQDCSPEMWVPVA